MEASKRGSSRRKGDEYQDLTALQLALENYIARTPFEMFLEYEKSGNLDDIVLFQGIEIIAYQVKYAVNPLAVYKTSDFVDPNSPVNLKKFSDSWKVMRERFPDHTLTAHLYSNRALDAALVDLLTPDGAFTPEVIEDRRKGNAKKLRSVMASASGLNTDSFGEFLTDFQFRVRQRTLTELEQYIRTFLLDKELGLSDDGIFLDLKEAIKQNAIFSREPITIESIDKLLERLQSKLLIPQVFPVNQDHFVEQKSLSKELDKILPRINGGYLIVTGLPGSGKSTSLTSYFDAIDRAEYEVFSYYCIIGVNDNAQKMRIQAESLRANLLSEFHRRYPDILERRFDYSERNFLECLKTLAEFFVKQGRQFVIFLDGLDHAERLEPEVRDTVISALPSDVPKGVAIVLGTQELHKWPHFLKRTRESPETHIQMPLFSVSETKDYLENKRSISGLSHTDIVEIHKKCEGLPLYLWYAAKIILSSDVVPDAIDSLFPAEGGDIHNYYGLLWAEFDRVGMADARHLCGVMACLRFSVHRDEIHRIQQSLRRSQFEDAYKCISHLLRALDDRLDVFHPSFCEFVIRQLNANWIQEIRANIADYLKTNKDSPRWFEHVFEYCYAAGDYKYILDNVNTDFVERALLRFRPSKDIFGAINCAIKTAYKQNNIVQISRIGSLNFRTSDRLNDNLDRALLADALLALGREQDVISFAFSQEANRWIVDEFTSLSVLASLADEGKLVLGRKLFGVFRDEFKGIDSNNGEEVKSLVIGIARSMGIYAENQNNRLKWLSQYKFKPSIMEQDDTYAPKYEPHFAVYIDALVKFKHTGMLNEIKHLKGIFPKNLVLYYLIRAYANHNCINRLRVAVTNYWKKEKPKCNIELAFFAAKAGMPASDVAHIAGTIEAPIKVAPKYISPNDHLFRHHAYSLIIVAYENSEDSYESLLNTVGTAPTLWNAAFRHLLKACFCIGRSFQNTEYDWFKEARQSIDIIVEAEQGDGERIIESIDLFRELLPMTIGLMTEQIQKFFPERLGEWISGLGTLRDSMLWTTHFGITESIQDYNFELRLWETLAKIPQVSLHLAPILKSCADTYKKSTLLKGGSRSDHFIRLSAIMAKCGMRQEADLWLQYGIRSSLIYGYHKDLTLTLLIDTLNLVNQHQPKLALERCARVLSMVDWMPHLTDGRETRWFPEQAFGAVLKMNRKASFDLIKYFSHKKAGWVVQSCLEEYLLNTTDGDPEYLWCLTELFANHLSDDGEYCRQIIGIRQHIIDLVEESSPGEVFSEFDNRFRRFVLTEITPRHWPEAFKIEFKIPTDIYSENEKNTMSEGKQSSGFMLDGERVTEKEIVDKCRVSFSDSLVTLDKLKAQNDHFKTPGITSKIMIDHIARAKSSSDLVPIKEFVESQGYWQNSNIFENLAKRFTELMDQDNAVKCYGKAYTCYSDWFPWRKNTKYLQSIAAIDKMSVEGLVLKKCYDSAHGSGGGFGTPPIAAAGLDVLNKHERLESVFNDFLTHCESLFEQLPQKDDYAWMKKYKETSADANQLILEFIVDELDAQDIDHGERLIRAVTRLAIARSDDTIPLLINRMLFASGRILRRLLTVFHCLVTYNPELLVPYQKKLVQLLKREDFFCRHTILHILHCMDETSPLEASVASVARRTEGKYSAQISYSSTYRMPSNPTPKFKHFLEKNSLFDFYAQVEVMEKIINAPTKNLIAAIEERLIDKNWSMDEERARIKYDWDGHVHPQGWPVVWITTEFQELAIDTLWGILNQTAEKLKLSNEQIHWLWRTIQLVDPEYILRDMMPRPSDIPLLNVCDKEAWFGELDLVESIQFVNNKTKSKDEEWITVFEKRRMSQEEIYNVPYIQEISQKAFLIPQQLYGGTHLLDNLDLKTENIVPFSSMPVTFQQAQRELNDRGQNILNTKNDCIPLIAVHQNPMTFFGYLSVCTLSSFIIDEFDLSFRELDLIRDGKVIGKYEAWQEGYQDESYTREILSFGVRFKVHRDLLTEICTKYGKILCVKLNEKRSNYKSIYDKKPDDSKFSKRFILYHL